MVIYQYNTKWRNTTKNNNPIATSTTVVATVEPASVYVEFVVVVTSKVVTVVSEIVEPIDVLSSKMVEVE
jgi:hypothetical protein